MVKNAGNFREIEGLTPAETTYKVGYTARTYDEMAANRCGAHGD